MDTSALCEGYQKIRQLSVTEKSLLKRFIEYGATATAFWRYRQYNIRLPGIGKEKAYEEMMKLAIHIDSIPDSFFIKQVFEG